MQIKLKIAYNYSATGTREEYPLWVMRFDHINLSAQKKKKKYNEKKGKIKKKEYWFYILWWGVVLNMQNRKINDKGWIMNYLYQSFFFLLFYFYFKEIL